MTRRKRAIEGSGIARNLAAGSRMRAPTLAVRYVPRSMRRFATWCTGHRKTVIIGWIVALIGVGMIAGSVGSDFSEDFKLPASDSTDAFDLLENKFPAQSGDTATIVFKAEGGVEAPAVKRPMEGLFAEAEGLPHVSEVASPYEGGGAAAISEDGKIAYATVQYDVFTDEIEEDDTEGADRRAPRRRTATASRSSSAASRSRKRAPKKKATSRS